MKVYNVFVIVFKEDFYLREMVPAVFQYIFFWESVRGHQELPLQLESAPGTNTSSAKEKLSPRQE